MLLIAYIIITVGCNRGEATLSQKNTRDYVLTERIMNRVKVGDEIKHIEQQALLDNLDALSRERGGDRIYVINPEGKRGTIEIRNLRSALNSGYQLINDTEGYNNRPDIRAKKLAKTDNSLIINLKSLKMDNLIIPILLLIVIFLIIVLSNKEVPPKHLIINENAWRWVKIIIAVSAIYIAYLFALNGRYTNNSDFITPDQLEYRDKWKIQMQHE